MSTIKEKWFSLARAKYTYYAVMDKEEEDGINIATAVIQTEGVGNRYQLEEHLRKRGYVGFDIMFVSWIGYWQARWMITKASIQAFFLGMKTEHRHRTIRIEDDEQEA